MKSRLAFLALLGHAACAQPEDRSTDFTYLHAAIIEPSCATALCHSKAAEKGDVDLSDVDEACDTLADTDVLTLLEGNGTVIPRMPLDVPLPPADIALMRAWVDAGAPCD